MALPETEREILDYLDGLTRGINPSDLRCFTTVQIAAALSISRSHASEHLNDLVRMKLVVKAGSRPLYYFHKRSLERFLQLRLDASSYVSAEKLLSMHADAEKRDFRKLVGYGQSLGSCIEQCIAALEYPYGGLPVLLVGEPGVGKTTLSRLAYEYGVNRGILCDDAKYQLVECSAFSDDIGSFRSLMSGEEGAESLFDRMNGGIVVLRDVDRLPSTAMELVISMISGVGDASSEARLNKTRRARLFLLTSKPSSNAIVCSLGCKVPIVVTVPTLRDRSQREREALALRFLRLEGRRMGVDVRIARSAFHHLVSTNFPDNVRGLQSCIRSCCANAYPVRHGDSIEIKTYLLPSTVLSEVATDDLGEDDDGRLIDVVQDVEDTDDRQMIGLFSAVVELAYRAFAGEITSDAMVEGVKVHMCDFEDRVVFGGMAANAKSRAYERVVSSIVSRINEAYDIDLTRKIAMLISREIYLQLFSDTQLMRWELVNAAAVSELYAALSDRWQLARVVVDRIGSEVAHALGVSLSTLMRIPLLVEIGSYETALSKRRSAGIVLSHGYATASSIADAANRMLHTHMFEAIDMNYDQQLSDIVGPLQNVLSRLAHCHEIALLVDMGSLEGIHDVLAGLPGMTVGVINNASTGLALEVGAGLMAGEGLRDVLASAISSCQSRYELFEDASVEDAVLFSSDGGVGAAEKIRGLVQQSLGREIGVRLIPISLQQLRRNGNRDQVFSHYRVRAIIGTNNPQVSGVPFVQLEDFISSDHTKAHEAFSTSLSSEEIESFHRNLIKNFTLENIVDALTILNPERLFSEIEGAVQRLGLLAGESVDELWWSAW